MFTGGLDDQPISFMRDLTNLKMLCDQFLNITKTEEWGVAAWQLATASVVEKIADEAINVTFGEQKTTVRNIALNFKTETPALVEPKLKQVWKDKYTGRKVVLGVDGLRSVRTHPESYEFVCETPHEDGDFSYICRREYCRCLQ